MRAIFVNHCHPDCPHVCGTRAREFAHALTRQGHRIVLLTETLRRHDQVLDPTALPAALSVHDWSVPFRLAVRPRPAPVLQALRAGRLPEALRAGVIAYQYVVRGGVFTDWRDASQAYWRLLAEAFRPDVVWGVFGNTDAWAIAQGIARRAGCLWVRDIKDLWTGFIPGPFHRLLSWRFGNAASTTALAQSLLDDAAPWFGKGRVVYSGVAASLIAEEPAPSSADGPFILVLVGGVYERASLDLLIEGIGHFAARHKDDDIRLVYAGSDGAQVADAARRLGLGTKIEIRGFLPFPEYWTLVKTAAVNLYVRVSGSAWHHKIVELLAARRPILCVAGEINEARKLVREAGGRLHEATNVEGVTTALESLWRSRRTPTPAATLRAAVLSWDAQARLLGSALDVRHGG